MYLKSIWVTYFADARGLVISDYQNNLEEKWVNELKEKYLVKENQKALQALLKSVH